MAFWEGVFDKIILERYMARFLTKRNDVIKNVAESNKWKDILK